MELFDQNARLAQACAATHPDPVASPQAARNLPLPFARALRFTQQKRDPPIISAATRGGCGGNSHLGLVIGALPRHCANLDR